MSVYMVTWNLNKEKPNYDAARKAFIQQIDRYTHTKDPGLETVRWVDTTWSPAQIRDDLKTKLDENDKLFICQVNRGQNDGWLSKLVWEWINART